MDKLYTLKEVGEITKLSKSTIYRHVKEGVLKPVKVGGSYRVSKEVLEKYMKGE